MSPGSALDGIMVARDENWTALPMSSFRRIHAALAEFCVTGNAVYSRKAVAQKMKIKLGPQNRHQQKTCDQWSHETVDQRIVGFRDTTTIATVPSA
jgi:hypothetical protein